jgi:DNA primase
MATVNQQGDQIETMIIQMIIRHGEEIIFENVETDDGGQIDMNAAEYVDYDLGSDNLSFHNPLYNRVLREAVEHSRDEGFKAADYFTRHPDVEISMLAAQLTTDRVQISKSLQKTPEEGDTRIRLEHLVLDFRFNYVVEQLKKLRARLLQPGLSSEEMKELITQINDMQMLRNKMARKLGRNDIIAS